MKMMQDVEGYFALLINGKEWLIERILKYATHNNFIKHTSSRVDVWRSSIEGITESLVFEVKKCGLEIHELLPDVDYSTDPVSYFGQLEAIKHRQRGVSISMFMALMKYYRQTYNDLIENSNAACEIKEKWIRFTERCFDRIELGYISEWTSLHSDSSFEELQMSNRFMANENNWYLKIFESLFAPVILLDDKARVVNYNLASLSLFSDIHVGDLFMEKLIPAGLPDMANWIQDFHNSTDEESYFESDLDTIKGRKYYKIISKKIADSIVSTLGTIIMFQDLTEQHKTEEILQEAKVKAEDADRLKTAFLANMSHEIRTPMNAIIGFTDLMLNEKNEFLKLIRRSSNDLLNIIDDIIDIAKLETKQLKIKYKACKPYEILSDLKVVINETLRKYGTNNDVELILRVG